MNIKMITRIISGFLLISSHANALELGRSEMVSPMTSVIEVFVSKERVKYGDVYATCAILDKDNNELDTVKTQFTQNRMPLYFKGRHFEAESVKCQLKNEKTTQQS